MSEVKIIVGDFHIGRGVVLDGKMNPREDFKSDEIFENFLRYNLNEYGNFELILNGDMFDIIKAASDEKGKVTKKAVFEFMEESFSNHKRFFESLKNFILSGGKIVYIVGNHDQAVASDDLQKFLRERIDPSGVSLRFVLREYVNMGVWIEHGHRYEVLNRTDIHNVWVKDELGEEILNMPWASKFVVDFISKLRDNYPYIDKVRPLKNFLKWGIFFETKFTLKTVYKIIIYWLKNRVYFDPIRKMSFRVSLRHVSNSLSFDAINNAVDKLMKRQDVDVFILGHTHSTLIQRKGNKVYANSGTWCDYISLNLHSLGHQSKMPFVFLKNDGNRWNTSLRFWLGNPRAFDEISV